MHLVQARQIESALRNWDHALDVETEPEKWRLVWVTPDSRKLFRDLVYCVVGGNGSPMYVKSSGKAVFDAKGQFRGYRGTGTDVTALIRAQEEHEKVTPTRVRSRAHEPPKHDGRTGGLAGSRNRATDCYRARGIWPNEQV
jgi:hypothetical protein